MPWAEVFVLLLAAYAACGVLFAIVFVTMGVERIDPTAAHAGKAFRLIILPGAIGLWPLLLLRWITCRATS